MNKLTIQQKSSIKIVGNNLPDSTIAITPVLWQYYESGTIILSSKSWDQTVVLRKTNFKSEKKYLKEIRKYIKKEWYRITNGVFSLELIKALWVEKKINKILSKSQK